MTTIRTLAATSLAVSLLTLTACGGASTPFGPNPGDLAATRGSDGPGDSSGTGSGADGSSVGSSGADDSTGGSAPGASGAIGVLRLRCELRTSGRSKVSVDGKDLPVGSYSARVRSGGNEAVSGLQASIGDEVEFDFDSDPVDIQAGATPIAPDFIRTSGSPDVTAEIRDEAGQTIVGGGADCRVRG